MRHALSAPILWAAGAVTATLTVTPVAVAGPGTVTVATFGHQGIRTVSVAPVVAVAPGRSGRAGIMGTAGVKGSRQEEQRLDEDIARLRTQLEGSSRELVEAAEDLSRAEARLVTVRADLVKAQDSLQTAKREDDAVASRLAYATAQENKADSELQDRVEHLKDARAWLGRIARQSYVTAGLPGLEVALHATTPQDFATRMNATGTVLRMQGGTVNKIAVEQADLRAVSARLEALRAQVGVLKERSEATVEIREAATRRAEEVRAQQATLVAQQARATAAIGARISQEKARLQNLEAEQNQARAQLAARARAHRAARDSARRAGTGSQGPRAEHRRSSADNSWSGSGGNGFGRPVQGPVTSPFGMRFHPVLHTMRRHTGVDFGAGCGVPVRAARSGQVTSAGGSRAYGNRIVIDHGLMGNAGVATTYNHLSRFAVTGGHVSAGQVIGYVGTTGLSTGCHLHFEVLRDGEYVDPLRYL